MGAGATVAEMTRDQLTVEQRANVWPGFSFLDDRGWGYGLSVRGNGSYGWEGGAGTSWTNVPQLDRSWWCLPSALRMKPECRPLCEDVLTAATQLS